LDLENEDLIVHLATRAESFQIGNYRRQIHRSAALFAVPSEGRQFIS